MTPMTVAQMNAIAPHADAAIVNALDRATQRVAAARRGRYRIAAPDIFTTRDYVRGHGMGLTDWDPADGEGFHVVLRRASQV